MPKRSQDTGNVDGKRRKLGRSQSVSSPNNQRPPTLRRSYSNLDISSSPNIFHQYRLHVLEKEQWEAGPVRKVRYRLSLSSLCLRTMSILNLISEIFNSALHQILARSPPGSIGQIFTTHPEGDMHCRCIATNRLPLSQLNFNTFAERLMAFLQSAAHVKLTDLVFTATVHSPPPPIGSHLTRQAYSQEVFARVKRCLINPLASRNSIRPQHQRLCFPLAVARALFALDNPKLGKSEAKLQNYSRTPACLARAQSLVRDAGLKPPLGPFSLDQLPLFENALPPNVSVYCYIDATTPFLCLNPSGTQSVYIFLCYETDSNSDVFHAYEINRDMMAAFTGHKYWCSQCMRGYHNKPHKCPTCSCYCGNVACPNTEPRPQTHLYHTCELCNLFFASPVCLEAHECSRKKRCEVCRLMIEPYRKHECGTPFCSLCCVSHDTFTICSVMPDAPKPTTKRVFYGDAECQKDSAGEHHANLVILMSPDGGNFTFKGPHAMTQFAELCTAKGSPFTNSFITFHNGAMYDYHLLYRALVKIGKPPTTLRDGQRLMSMEIISNKIVFRDSYLYISIPLAKFPTTFGLSTGAKGDFPHGLNTPEWIRFGEKIKYREVEDGVEHRFPRLEHFWLESKRPAAATELRKWHKSEVQRYLENPHLVYCPEEELVAYCSQDVRILMDGMEKLRATASEEHPEMELLNSVTFTSHVNSVFRTYHMPQDSITPLPPMGYEFKNRNYSVRAMAWLSFMREKLGLQTFFDARHLGERRIAGFYLDGAGFDENSQLHLLDFEGCFAHGCPCISKRTPELDIKFQNTKERREHILGLATSSKSPYPTFSYHTETLCGLTQKMQGDPELDSYITEYEQRFPKERLKPRVALRGGRTNVIQHYIPELKPGERIGSYDVTSMYPAVQLFEQYPIGPPTIYIGKEVDKAPPLHQVFGLVQLTIQPPSQLLHATLPVFINGRVLFPLCRTCAEQEYQGYCTHKESERSLRGVFCSEELKEALKWGYVPGVVEEIWHWPEEQRSSDLFSGIIKDICKKKAYASPLPTDLDQMLSEYEEMGIKLEKDCFDPNPTRREHAKRALNSLWGFLCMHQDKVESELVKNYARLCELENDSDREVTEVHLLDKKNIIVCHKPVVEPASRTGNVVLGVFVTAYGRLRLLNIIQQYPEQTIYFDTDSVFLRLKEGEPGPETSSALGGLKNELESYGQDAYISAFFSTGPKSYRYDVKCGEKLTCEIKFKGISLTDESAKILNPSAFEDLLTNLDTELKVPQHTIRKDIYSNSLRSEQYHKTARFLSKKRWFPSFAPPMATLPYGYQA